MFAVDERRHAFGNVSRLITLTENLPIIQVAIEDIRELDQEMWFGGPRKVKATCREVAMHAKRILAVDLSHPIILSAEGRVMDGMHRVTKAWMEGRTHIPALPFVPRALRPLWKPAGYPKEFRHSGDHLRAKRLDLGLTKKALARRLAVDEESGAT